MRYLSFGVLMACLLLLFCACGEKSWDGSTVPDTGALVKWSEQKMESDKKIIFIHGLNMGVENYQGSILQKVEKDFDLKLMNLNSLGSEYFGKKTIELVECWFYIYNTQQDIEKIANDLAILIRDNGKFKNAQIALVGYSQGGVVAWLIDQRYNLINGGVILGAPILSTPLAHKEILGKALNDVYPIAGESIKNGLASLADRVEHLSVSYPESGQAKSNLLFMIGSISIPSKNALSRNWALMETVINEGDYLVGNASSKRKLLEVGSLLIDSADWGKCKEGSCFSDGAVPVCSAAPNSEAKMIEWKDYDHEELLSGKGDFSLDRATVRHLGEVLDLFPKFMEADLPLLPELEIHFSKSSVWDWIKFAYIVDGKLFVTDEDWYRKELVYSGKNCYPRFGSNQCLTWTNLDNNSFNLCIWQKEDVIQRNSNSSKYASFSPSNEELVCQYTNDLVGFNLASGKSRVLVQDVNLIAPPVLVKNKSSYKIYFANQEIDGTINLRSTNSNTDNEYLIDTQVLVKNCSIPFLATGDFKGLVVISDIGISHQLIKVVTGGKLISNISIDITKSDRREISGTTKRIKLKLLEEFRFNSMVFDSEYGHLYLVGSVGNDNGVWLLDIRRIIVSSNAGWDEVFYSILLGVEAMDIKLTD